jgi:hypothetical protein
MNTVSKYATDFFGWATEQAQLLREGRLSEADIDNIAEEIESMGRGEKRELVNRLAVLLAHLLKWQFQPGLRGNSWRLTVIEQRERLVEHLKENPSLQSILPDAFATAYRFALLAAQRDTGLPESAFPKVCPYSFEQTVDEGFWPGAPLREV